MIKSLNITTLVENTIRKTGLLGEHGLSFWIEADTHRIIFDTGYGKALLHNANSLGIDLSMAEKLVLSHGHYDHTGGIPDLLNLNTQINSYLHPDALGKKYTSREKGTANIGISEKSEEMLLSESLELEINREPIKIVEGIWLTGEIPRINPFENTGGKFFQDEELNIVDPLNDDQALFIDTPKGIVIILGCAHSGVINTIEHIAKLADTEKIYAVFGGMHLVHAKRDRLDKTVQKLIDYDIQIIGPCHCTGWKAIAYLWEHFPGHCVECAAGLSFLFDDTENSL